MIPKVIHYCWFGRNPLPPLAIKCIESWKKYLPNYEIKEWNEDNFDVNIIPYTKEAYQAKKYAFVSDYARFWILYHYGGIYFDTDVEVIKPIDDIIACGSFIGCENFYQNFKEAKDLGINPGLCLGTDKSNFVCKKILDSYNNESFLNADGSYNLRTVVSRTTNFFCRYGLKNTNKIQICADVLIYPSDYFNPRNQITKRMMITENTRSIHHYMSSWQSNSLKEKILKNLQKIIPDSILIYWNKIKYLWLNT